ncbi:MAG: hypothetical protein KDK51_07735 [Deltaproteobacteria bacterium]|nr:hypothetical protein [Deltaproteobacteria bacterium]
MHRNKQSFFWNQQAFFDTYWQRQPWHGKKQLLVDHINIAATDLDHLCQQEAVTTRMLTQQNNTFSLRSPKWDVNDPSKRTLFIQEMDRWFPEVRDLYKYFPHYPRWRFDDIMGSYSTAGSCSSPHVDFYDVFILQVAGSKRWLIEKTKRNFEQCKGDALLPHTDLRIIKEVQDYDTYILEPGDILYVPTRFVHEATAIQDSFSYSIGLRSPRIKDMIAAIDPKEAQKINEDIRMEEDHIYIDNLSIPNRLLSHIHNWPRSIALPTAPTPLWFGKLATMPPDDMPQQAYLSDILLEDQEALLSELERLDTAWTLDPACKIAIQERPNLDEIHLFIQGEHIAMPKQARAFIEQLIQMEPWTSSELKKYFTKLPWNQQLWTYLCVNDLMYKA